MTLNRGQVVYISGSVTKWTVVRHLDDDRVELTRVIRDPHDARTKPGVTVRRTVNLIRLRREP